MVHRAPLIIENHTPQWSRFFEEEYQRLKTALPEPHFQIEHIGSTAVPGLAAKPIIDLMVGAPSVGAIEERIPALEALGYEYISRHEAAMPQRRFLAWPLTRPRRFHLHGVVQGSAFWNDKIAFRDALCADEGLAQDYENLKRQLAAQYGDDREGYTDAKTDFIVAVIQRARESAANKLSRGVVDTTL
jgi:GrpB-like predicted nucleotidyltransferase (UPF0157 family)